VASATRPLEGRRIVVTRPASQAAELAEPLRALGAEVVLLPTIEIVPPLDGGAALDAALAHLADYRWLVVTSVNGADAVLARRPDRPSGLGVAAIGPATAERMRRGGWAVDLVPDAYVAEALLDALGHPGAVGDAVLVARAAVARDVLPVGLRERGWVVEVVDAYRTVDTTVDADAVRRAAGADTVTFTSPSTVERFVRLVGAADVPPLVACIGPVTADAARAAGLTVSVEASTYTVAGLVAALVARS